MSFKSQVDPSPVVLGSTPCASQTNRGSPSLLLEPVPPACPAHHVDFVSWLCCGKIGAGILVTYNLAPFEGQGHIGKGNQRPQNAWKLPPLRLHNILLRDFCCCSTKLWVRRGQVRLVESGFYPVTKMPPPGKTCCYTLICQSGFANH